MLDFLREHFGFERFAGAQEEVIGRILAGEELCVVMPTGAGKSLCYQMPILMRPGYGLVLSPLIALMRDQVAGLLRRDIPAACLNSEVGRPEQLATMQELQAGRLKLLYVAPERFRTPGFAEFLQRNPPALLVVDEAHCISQWGHDFRPDYQLIWSRFPFLGRLQACAFTATATPYVRRDIKRQLRRPEMHEFVSGFRRPNLSFQVRSCRDREKDGHLARLLARGVPTIVYTSTRKEAELLAAKFRLECYHAGLPMGRRSEAQRRFMQDPCPVLVATNAFGMGIDRPDIRQVIHYNTPGSLEAYYQEAGRAGRDGQPADCILLHSYHDKVIQEFLLAMNHPDPRILTALHRRLRERQLAGSPGWRLDGDLSDLALPKVSPKTAQSALRILERCRIVVREPCSGGAAPGELSLLGPADRVARENEAEATQRSRLLHRAALALKRSGRRILPCTLAELADCCGLPVPNVVRALQALEGLSLHWLPPFSGDVYRLTGLGMQESLQVDLDELRRQKEYDQERLDEVQRYCRTRGCRQNHLIAYFGEEVDGQWRCGTCDLCRARRKAAAGTGRPATAAECAQARTALLAVASIDGEFGRRRIAGMLYGRPDASPALHRHPLRGALGQLSPYAIGHLLDVLERQDYLVQTQGEYPCLKLSAKAFQALRTKGPVPLLAEEED